MKKLSHARGMTLIEALVALVVLSVGLLGVAGMQMTALRNNLGAHLRSQATVLAYDITDRMRANRTVARDTTAYIVGMGAAPTGGTLAALDIQYWKTTMTNTLPAGDGSIRRVGDTYEITITWTEQNAGVQSFTTHTRI